MTLLTALFACGPTPAPVTTVRGLQVVAMVTDPPEPLAREPMSVEVWVADGLGRGADVLVWLCTPVDGRCLEHDALPGADGLPLLFVTQTGRADPTFRARVAWPLLADIARGYVEAQVDEVLGEEVEDAGSGLFVWALACVPGTCDVIEQVRADPVAGSATWRAATDALADPSLILDDLPPGEASVAVKFVPLYTDEASYATTFRFPNQLPLLDGEAGLPGDPISLQWADPDGDEVEIQSFTTAGAVSASTTFQGVEVDPSPGARGQYGDVFVVAEDGRGGTAVWSTVGESAKRCAPTVSLPTGPDPGDLYAPPSPDRVRFSGFPDATLGVDARITDEAGNVVLSGEARYEGGYGYGYYYGSGYTTGSTPKPQFDPCTPRDTIVSWNYGNFDPCELSGQLLTYHLTARGGGSTANTEVQVIAGPGPNCP